MEKTKTLHVIVGLCLVLLCMAQTAFAAVPVTNSQPLDINDILEAVSPLVEAEKKFYTISEISVTGTENTVKNDGTIDTTCNIVMNMCLKAQSAEELPYVAGMLSELRADTAEECYAVASKVPLNTVVQSTSQEILLAAQVTPQLREIAENIGNDITLTFSVVINTELDGTINQVLGCGDRDSNGSLITFPLEEYFPESTEAMFEQGADAVIEMRKNLQTANANTVIKVSDKNPLYYRVKARDYVQKYSSEAPTSKVCPHGRTRIDTSYYNKNYTYYCHNDCANFVSQAIYAGGMPTNSTWYPGSFAWINVGGLRQYFYLTKGYWYYSDYAKCNAGNIIINVDSSGSRYHVNMCVLNDTVNRAYAAHNADHSNKAYSSNYWGSETVEFYKFNHTTPT